MVDNRKTEITGADDPVTWAFVTGVQMLGAGRASLLVRDEMESVLFAVATVGISSEVAQHIRVPVGEGIAGIVAQRGIAFFGTRGEDTFLCLPIVTDRGVEGVLNATNRLGARPFGDEDIHPFRLVAAHVAQLLKHRRRTAGGVHVPPRKTGSDVALPAPGDRLNFEDMLERELARSKRTGSPFAVAFVDLVSTTAADEQREFIAGVEAALQHVLRRYDCAAHYGGNRFAVVLAGPSSVSDGLIRRIVGAVEEYSKAMDATIGVRVGLAHCPADGIGAQQLLAAADTRIRDTTQARSLASS